IPPAVGLPRGGAASAGADSSYWAMLLASVAGSVVGACLLYGLGRLLGPQRLRRIVIRLPLAHVGDYDKSVEFMDRHGCKAIFFGRVVPGTRALISIPARLSAMPIGMFTLLTAAGSAIWNSVFVTIGYYMGSNWTVIEPYTDIFSDVVYVAVALVVAVFVVRLILRERRRRRLGLPDPDRAHLEELETGAVAEQSEER